MRRMDKLLRRLLVLEVVVVREEQAGHGDGVQHGEDGKVDHVGQRECADKHKDDCNIGIPKGGGGAGT